MMSVTRRLIKRNNGARKGAPTIIKWQGVPMIRSHSIRSVAQEIINASEAQDFISINIIGKQGTGKTELAKTLSHLIHDGAKLPYQVHFWGKDEMLDLENVVKGLSPDVNHIMTMDDVSFLKSFASNQQLMKLQQTLSVIRHLPEKDIKVIVIKNQHYTKALSPFLRQADFHFISSVDSSEISNMEDLLGKKYHLKINMLKNLRVQTKIGGEKNSVFVYPLGNGLHGKSLKYKSRKPFLPFLYSNQLDCRIIVSPLRQWISPICNVCAPIPEKETTTDDDFNFDLFLKGFHTKFGKENVAKQAVKIKLIQNGINTYSPRIVRAVKYLDKFLSARKVSLEQMANAFDLTPTITNLQPSPKDVKGVFEK